MPDSTTHNQDIDFYQLAMGLKSAPRQQIYEAAVNLPFDQKVGVVMLFLGFISLYVYDPEAGTIRLVANTPTEQYQLAVENYNFRPESYVLKIKEDASNTIVQAVVRRAPMSTADWGTLSRFNVPPRIAQLNQANSGIAYSAVYPLTGSKFQGAVMYNFYQVPEQIGDRQKDFMERYSDMILARLDS